VCNTMTVYFLHEIRLITSQDRGYILVLEFSTESFFKLVAREGLLTSLLPQVGMAWSSVRTVDKKDHVMIHLFCKYECFLPHGKKTCDDLSMHSVTIQNI